MKNKNWEKVIKELENGKSIKEATNNTPLAVKIKPRRFGTLQISSKQQQAIRRG